MAATATLGDFVRLPGCSATYRLQHGESGLSGWRDKQAMYFAHSLVLDKIRLVDATGVSRALFWFDTALNHVQGEKEALATVTSSRPIRMLWRSNSVFALKRRLPFISVTPMRSS